jgi:hypothetical protein
VATVVALAAVVARVLVRADRAERVLKRFELKTRASGPRFCFRHRRFGRIVAGASGVRDHSHLFHPPLRLF